MRAVVVALVVAVACTAPVAPPASSEPASTPAPSATAAAAPPSAPSGSPTAAALSSPTSGGPVPNAGVLFVLEQPPLDLLLGGRAEPAVYRYDGTTGALTRLTLLAPSRLEHDTSAGVLIAAPQGRWDLLRWDGTRATDEEFTACQSAPGRFASFCVVTRAGIGVGFGSHVALSCTPAFLRMPGQPTSRPIVADGLCIDRAWANDDASTLVVTGVVPSGPVGGGCAAGLTTFQGTCYRPEVWVVPSGATPRRLALPDLPGGTDQLSVSPDGRHAAVVHLGGLFRVDLSTGRATHLGAVSARDGAARWSPDGRLVFVRGAGSATWTNKVVVVVATDGTAREVGLLANDGRPQTGLAPVWDPTGRRLAWVAAPVALPSDDPARDHLAGRGVGERRVLVSDLAGDPAEVRCAEGVAEGARWSHDGNALLLLCRRPERRVGAFDLWLHPLAAGERAVPLVRGLTLGGVDTEGAPPDLSTRTGWSRGLDVRRP